MKELIVKNGWFADSDLRLDATYYLSDGPLTKLKMKVSPYKVSSLSKETSEIFKGNIFKRTYVSDAKFGYHFMTASDMMKSNIESGKFVSKKYTDTANLFLKEGWILVSRSGTLGNIVYTNKDFDGVLGTDDLIRVIPNNKGIKSGFMYAYLATKYGYGLLTQSGYGGVVQHIEPHHIENLPIPVFPTSKQEKIHNLIIDSSTLRVEANKILNETIKYFENLIGESGVHLGYQISTISSKKLFGFQKRLDGQYQLLWKALKKEEKRELNYELISNYAKSIFVGGRGKRIYVEKGIPFLSSSEMMLYNPKNGCKKVSKNTPGLSSMTVSKKDILISRSGTIGNTVLVGENLSQTAISEHALRLVIDSKKISPNYVFCFLKTKYGKKSMEASSFGSVIITLNEELIGKIKMPILNSKQQKFINEKIDLYLSKMDESTSKENKAIELVEKEIELWQK